MCAFFVGDSMNYMKIALKEAFKAYKAGDVPVGAVIVKNNKIISKAHNKKKKNKNAINHAEIIVINKVCKKLKTWHLNDCILYTTMEPCMMCCGAIIQSRIKEIHYILDNDQFGCLKLLENNNTIIKENDDSYKNMINDFFIKLRVDNVSRETLKNEIK